MKLLKPGFAREPTHAHMASQTLCVWAAPVKRQMPLHAQPGTSTYVWAWPSAPIVVRPLRIIARPVAPAQLQLPHLLGRRSWAMSPEPPKNPKTKAPPKGELRMICVAATPVRRPSKTTIPETGVATPPAQQAPLPPSELEHTPRVRRRWAEGGGRDRMCSTLYST